MTRTWSHTTLRASPRPTAVRRVNEVPLAHLMDWMFDVVEEVERLTYPMGGNTDDKGPS